MHTEAISIILMPATTISAATDWLIRIVSRTRTCMKCYFYQNIWTTGSDLKNGEINVYNENFFRDLSAYALEWEVLKNGKAVRSGRVENLSVAPRQTANVKLDLGKTCKCAEWLLNVKIRFRKKSRRTASGWSCSCQGTVDPESL